MNEFMINFTTPVLFGENTSLQTGAKLKELGCTKALFIYDQGIKKAGIPDKVIKAVEEAGIGVAIFDTVIADPPYDSLEAAAAIGREAGVDCVVAIGGGSSMDTAKGTNLLLTNEPPLNQYMTPGGPQFKPGKPIILIPTTSGTGSEVTSVAVLTDPETHTKGGINSPLARATLAIVDPTLCVGMPPAITADTGLDALVHAIEAVTANRANPMTDIVGERAISIIMEWLPKAVKDGSDIEARSQMAFASMIAGYAFNDSMTHLGHSVGHTLGALYHLPHGNACGIILPELVEYIAETVADATKKVAVAMGLDASGSPKEVGEKIAKALLVFYSIVGQKTLKENNIAHEDLPKIAEMAEQDITALFCPRKAGKEEILTMLESAYKR